MSLNKKRKYIANIILNTRGYEDPVDTLVEKIKGVLSELGAEVSDARDRGRLDFARVTRPGHTSDSYLQVEFSGDPAVPAAFHDKLRLDRTVKRIIIQSA